MSKEKKDIIWEIWYTYRFGDRNKHVGTGQVNTAAPTIEEAIAHVKSLNLEEDRLIYKIEDKGFIV